MGDARPHDSRLAIASEDPLRTRLLEALFARAAARARQYPGGDALDDSGPDPDDAWLLWHLGARGPALAALERAAGTGRAAAALALCLATDDDEALVRRGLDLLARFDDPRTRGELARILWLELWLQRDAPEQASALARASGRLGSPLDIWPLPRRDGGRTEEPGPFDRWLSSAWREALARRDWRRVLRLMITAALAGVRRLPEPATAVDDLPRVLGPWFIDHAMESLAPGALTGLAEDLDDAAEATALRVLGCVLLERHDPLLAAFDELDLAESGADHLPALLRARAQRALVSAGRFAEAADVAAGRTGYCQDPELVIGLLLCSVLHGLLADELPDNLADQARQLHETCHRLHRSQGAADAMLSELCGLTMSMCEVSAYALGGRRGLATLYDQLEIGNDTRARRHVEALLLEGDDPLPMAVLDALQVAATQRPLALPMLLLRGDTHRVAESELTRVLSVLAARHPEMARGLASLQLWLDANAELDPRARAAVDASTGLRRQVLAMLGVGQHDEAERIEVVDRLCEAIEPDVAVAARLMRARRFLDEGSPQAAVGDLTQVASLLEGRSDPTLAALVERAQDPLGDPDLATRVQEMGTRRRLEQRLEAEPEAERAWQMAVELGRDGRWADGAEHLLEAGQQARDPWLASRLLQLAVRWFDEHARAPQRALEAARVAAGARPLDVELRRLHARLLARQGELVELDALLASLPASASNGKRPPRPIDLVDRELAATLRWIVTRTTRRPTDDDQGDDHQALVAVLDRCLRLDGLSAPLRLELLRAWATLRTWQGATAEVHARLTLALEGATQPDERAALALLLARHEPRAEHAVECLLTALSQPDTRRAALRHLTELHARSRENQRFVDRLLTAADGLAAPDAARQVRLHAARLLVEHLGRADEAARLLEDLVPAEIDNDADLTLLETLLERTGRHESMVRVLEQRIIRETTPALRAALRLRMAELIGDTLPEQARALRVAALRDAPTDRALFESLTDKLRADGQTRLLHEVLDIAIEAGRRQSGNALRLADLLVERGQIDLEVFDDADSAARSFMDALRLDPRNDLIVARIELLAGMLGEPYLVGLAREIRLAGTPVGDPDRGRALVAAARSHISVGALGRAIPQLEEAFALEPAAADVAMLLVDQLGLAGHPGRRAVVCMAHAEALAETRQLTALLHLARYQDEQLGLAHDAVASLEAIIERAPEHAEAHDALVEIYATHEDWEGVLEVTEHALDHVALDGHARADLLLRVAALYLEKLGNTRRAVIALREARELAPDHAAVLETLRGLLVTRGEWDEALAVTERLAALQDDDEARVALLVDGARMALDELDEPSTATRLVTEALEVAPDSVRALDAQLDLCVELGDWPRARALCQQLEASPGVEPASLALREGIIARGEGHPREATRALLRVLDLTPTADHVGRALDTLLEVVDTELDPAGDDDLFEHTERKLASHRSRAPEAADTSALCDALVAVLRTRARRVLELGDEADEAARARALGWLERATVLAPPDASIQELHCELLLRHGHPGQALQRTLDLVGHLERGTRAWRRAMLQAGALALEAVDDPERAIDLLTELRRRAPGELDASYQLARAWLALGDAHAARRHVERVVAAWDGADPTAMPERQRQAAADHHHLLGQIVERLGEPDAARQHYERAARFLHPASG